MAHATKVGESDKSTNIKIVFLSISYILSQGFKRLNVFRK